MCANDLANIQGHTDTFKVVFRSENYFISSKIYYFLKLLSFVSLDLISAEICFCWLRCLAVVFAPESSEKVIAETEKTVALKSKGASVILSQFKVMYAADMHEWEHFEWRRRHYHNLPKYLSLCREVYRELVYRIYVLFKIKANHKFLLAMVEFIVFVVSYGLPIGHLLTEIGIVYWYVVVEKIFIFFLVCIGVWTDS